jgi:hypothetical protein
LEYDQTCAQKIDPLYFIAIKLAYHSEIHLNEIHDYLTIPKLAKLYPNSLEKLKMPIRGDVASQHTPTDGVGRACESRGQKPLSFALVQ